MDWCANCWALARAPLFCLYSCYLVSHHRILQRTLHNLGYTFHVKDTPTPTRRDRAYITEYSIKREEEWCTIIKREEEWCTIIGLLLAARCSTGGGA